MKEFKAESKRLLELMINSIYTNREIFLRELISNASDAIDKRHFKSLTDSSAACDFKITVSVDVAQKTLTVTDNGIGMTELELENNLGTIAMSGTNAFKKESGADAGELIGQFGVGFYSAFMAADKLVVKSRAFGTDKSFIWTSNGVDGYEISPCESIDIGTSVTLHLKADDDDMAYSTLLERDSLVRLIKKYSDYIRYPIYVEGAKCKDDCNHDHSEPVNSMTPIWKQPKNKVTAESRNQFYKTQFHDYHDPRLTVTANIEGAINYNALLFVPYEPSYDYYSKDYKRGLALYSNGVLIEEKCESLLPEYLGFIRGVVDSSDLSLNISREMLQHDRQLRAIALGIEKKILSEFEKTLKNDRDTYNSMFAAFAKSIKYGAYENFGAAIEKLKNLLLFYSSTQKSLVTLAEYVARMREGQDAIYYACGESVDKISRLPQLEGFDDKQTEVLFFTDAVDEFIIKMMENFEGKTFKNISTIDSEPHKESKPTETSDSLITALKNALKGKVADVKPSDKLKTSPVCVSSRGEITLEMERIYKAMGQPLTASRVLEVNLSHPVFDLIRAHQDDPKTISDYAIVLYNEAIIAEGYAPENDFINALNNVISLSNTAKKAAKTSGKTADSTTDKTASTAKKAAKASGKSADSATDKTASTAKKTTKASGKSADSTTDKTASTAKKTTKASGKSADSATDKN